MAHGLAPPAPGSDTQAGGAVTNTHESFCNVEGSTEYHGPSTLTKESLGMRTPAPA